MKLGTHHFCCSGKEKVGMANTKQNFILVPQIQVFLKKKVKYAVAIVTLNGRKHPCDLKMSA